MASRTTMESPGPLGGKRGKRELAGDGTPFVLPETPCGPAKEQPGLTLGPPESGGGGLSSKPSRSPAGPERRPASPEDAPRPPFLANNMKHWWVLTGAATKADPGSVAPPRQVRERERSGRPAPPAALEAVRQLGRGVLPRGRREPPDLPAGGAGASAHEVPNGGEQDGKAGQGRT